MQKVVVGVCMVLLANAGTAHAQWLGYPDRHIPRRADGKPLLDGRAPRAADGKPDLSGVWHVESESVEQKIRLFGPEAGKFFTIGMEPDTYSKYAVDILLDYAPGEIAMTAEGQAIYQRRRQGHEIPPTSRCLPAGVPLATLLSEVQKIVQTPGLVLVMHELDFGMSRQIYTDGRPLPRSIQFPSWLGYSVGRWEGDTLVVDTVGFNDRSWLDMRGHPRSEAMHVTERYRRPDVGHLNVEITFDDPRSYSRPFTVHLTHLLEPDSDILEYVCTESPR